MNMIKQIVSTSIGVIIGLGLVILLYVSFATSAVPEPPNIDSNTIELIETINKELQELFRDNN